MTTKPKKKKTAVIVVHGIGEQRPMETLNSFVQAAWIEDTDLVHPSRSEVFSKPELVSGSFELRRITTREANIKPAKRFDFFEFYWAHHMQGHKITDLTKWLAGLFFRSPKSVPPKIFGLWLFGMTLVLLAVLIVLGWAAPYLGLPFCLPGWLAATLSPPLAFSGYLFNKKVLPYAGDAARYLSAAPRNVAIRQRIRTDGVSLIEKLTTSGAYDRIVLVGHSLGSVIAYDIVNFAWNRLNSDAVKSLHKTGAAAKALNEVEQSGLALLDAAEGSFGAARVDYREKQRAYFTALKDAKNPLWLVSDLVTLGAPLSKAELLLAQDLNDFEKRCQQRELPTCPPVYETSRDGKTKQFSYPVGNVARRPHHAAVFAAVVWSNIFFPNRWIIIGDVISGPVRKLFGRGVMDIKVPIGEPPRFRHTSYWTTGKKARAATLTALRKALNLAGKQEEAEIWGDKAEQTPVDGGEL